MTFPCKRSDRAISLRYTLILGCSVNTGLGETLAGFLVTERILLKMQALQKPRIMTAVPVHPDTSPVTSHTLSCYTGEGRWAILFPFG